MNWIYLDIVNEDVLPIANKLMNKELEREGYKIEENPHVTIIPKFEVSEEVEILELRPNKKFKVSGFKFWPDFEDPMVVMLDVSDDMVIQLWRDEILSQIGKNSLEQELVPPHITLFKAGNMGDEYNFRLNADIRNDLLDRCDSIDLPTHVRAKGLKMSKWENNK